MLFKGAMSSVIGSEHPSISTDSSLLQRDLPPTPVPTSPVPSFGDFQENYVPPWMRDTASTTSTTRHSRASSIVSNLTRFTTTSIDDARSIDIQAGGQNFRIARDASKITSEAPPPYTVAGGDTIPQVLEELQPRSAAMHTPPSDSSSDEPVRLSTGPRVTARARVPTRARVPAKPQIATTLGANILDPSEVDIPSPVGNDNNTPLSTPRSGIYTSERTDSSIGNLPRDYSGYGTQIDSQETLTRSVTVKPFKYTDPRQKADLPLLSTTSNVLEKQGMRPRPTQFQAWQTMSTDDLLFSHPEQRSPEPQSPNFIGRNADGLFPQQDSTQARVRSDSGYSGQEHASREDDDNRTPSMDSENDISLHYARMIRFVDKQHRRVLHARDKEMEQLRERIAEMDIVYRQQLKARDFVIEDLHKRLRNLEQTTEARLEKARNAVEDLWEARWKDRDFHLRERMSRIESQAGLHLQRSGENLASHDDH